MLYTIIMAVAVVCAIEALRAKRLLASALWLAGTSAMTAIVLYLLGAPEVAVIELSVGAGLVTVLFVFAINIAGENSLDSHPIIPRPIAWILVSISVGLLAVLSLPGVTVPLPESVGGVFTGTVWEQRGLDILVQVALIFAGVLGVLGLLSESSWATDGSEEVHS